MGIFFAKPKTQQQKRKQLQQKQTQNKRKQMQENAKAKQFFMKQQQRKQLKIKFELNDLEVNLKSIYRNYYQRKKTEKEKLLFLLGDEDEYDQEDHRDFRTNRKTKVPIKKIIDYFKLLKRRNKCEDVVCTNCTVYPSQEISIMAKTLISPSEMVVKQTMNNVVDMNLIDELDKLVKTSC